MSAQLIIPAAGLGRRLGLRGPKALTQLCGRSLVARTLERILAVEFTDPAIIIVPPGGEEAFREALSDVPSPILFIEGGEERRDSVLRGLNELNPDTEIVVIHDAARPFPPIRAVCEVIEAARQYGAATLAMPVSDTILVDDGAGFLAPTPDRSLLWACQTPQAFQVEIIRRAHNDPRNRETVCTDDATLAQRIDCQVKLIVGSAMNFKVTTKHDLVFAGYLLERGLP